MAVTSASAAVPAAKTSAASVPAAKVGVSATVLSTAKAAVISPIFGVVALGGIIAFEWWKGSRDAREFATAEKADS